MQGEIHLDVGAEHHGSAVFHGWSLLSLGLLPAGRAPSPAGQATAARLSWCRYRFPVPRVDLVDLGYFAGRVAPLKFGLDPRRDDGLGRLGSDDARAQGEDLRVVALARPLGRVDVVGLSRAHPGHL